MNPDACAESAVPSKSRAHIVAYVGSRTTKERGARGEGLTVYAIEQPSGAWRRVQTLGDLVNPSYLALGREQRHLYAIHGDFSEISAFAVDRASGELTFLNQQSTGGKNPVHLAVDPSGRFVVVANHLSSSLALITIRQDGSLGERATLFELEGTPGPHRIEQPFAKPHQCVFDPSGRFIAVPDKGLDRVFMLRIDPDRGRLVANDSLPVVAREGAGPRHIDFHPHGRFAYVVNELDSTVTAYGYDPGTGILRPFQIVPTLPDDFVATSRAAAIAASRSGRFLYASNRGHDSIAGFEIDRRSGRLSPIGCYQTQGRTPRFFAFGPSGTVLFVAHEDSDTIVGFDIRDDGALAMTGVAAQTGSPVCIVFAVLV